MPQEFFQYLPATSQAPQPRQWFAEIADESILRLPDPFDAGTPDLAPAEIWRGYVRTVNLRSIVATVLDALGLDPRLAPEPVLERQADQRSDEWLDRYRADAEREGLPV